MSMKIITGSTGATHVTSNNDGEFNQSIWGDDLVVLANGNQLAATITDNNTITIKDGDLVLQGRHALIEPGTTEDVTIETGAVGKNRIDLIVAHYEIDTTTGYENITLKVIKGTESSGTPSAPSYTEGVIRTGSTIAESPLYQVLIENVAISSVTAQFEIEDAVTDQLDSLRSNLVSKFYVFESTFPTITDGTIVNVDIEYPSGFTIDNSIIISFMVKDNNNAWRLHALGSFSTSFRRCFAYCNNTGITVSCNDGGMNQKQFKVCIMRTDI